MVWNYFLLLKVGLDAILSFFRFNFMHIQVVRSAKLVQINVQVERNVLRVATLKNQCCSSRRS